MLTDPEFSIDHLLEHEHSVSQFKSQNQNLVQFITPPFIKQLILYSLSMPLESDSPSRKYKYPFISSEILSSDNDHVN